MDLAWQLWRGFLTLGTGLNNKAKEIGLLLVFPSLITLINNGLVCPLTSPFCPTPTPTPKARIPCGFILRKCL